MSIQSQIAGPVWGTASQHCPMSRRDQCPALYQQGNLTVLLDTFHTGSALLMSAGPCQDWWGSVTFHGRINSMTKPPVQVDHSPGNKCHLLGFKRIGISLCHSSCWEGKASSWWKQHKMLWKQAVFALDWCFCLPCYGQIMPSLWSLWENGCLCVKYLDHKLYCIDVC